MGFGNFVVVGLIFFLVNDFTGTSKIFIGSCSLMLLGNNDCHFFFKVSEGFLAFFSVQIMDPNSELAAR